MVLSQPAMICHAHLSIPGLCADSTAQTGKKNQKNPEKSRKTAHEGDMPLMSSSHGEGVNLVQNSQGEDVLSFSLYSNLSCSCCFQPLVVDILDTTITHNNFCSREIRHYFNDVVGICLFICAPSVLRYQMCKKHLLFYTNEGSATLPLCAPPFLLKCCCFRWVPHQNC